MYRWLARRCYVYQARLGLTVVYLALTCELALKVHHHTQPSPNCIFKIYFLFYLCVFLCVCHGCVGTHRGSWKFSDSLKMELQVTVSHLVCVLGPEPRSSGMLSATEHPSCFKRQARVTFSAVLERRLDVWTGLTTATTEI